MRQGVIDVLCGAPINWTSTVPQLGVLHAAVPDARPQGLGRGLRRRALVRDYFEMVRKAGAEPLAIGETGYRQISNSKHPVIKPDDLKGLKVRVVGSPMYGEIMSSMGANPTFMSWADTQPALASGAVDGQENPLEVFLAAKVQHARPEVRDQVELLERHPAVRDRRAGLGQLDAGRPEDRARVRRRRRQAAGRAGAQAVRRGRRSASLRSASTSTCRPPAEMEAWQIAARRPYARYKAQTQPQIVSRVEEIVARTRKA